MIPQNNILFDVQKQIADIIRADEQLSAITWLEENRRDIDFEIKNALGKQGIVGLITTPNAEYIGDYNNQSLVWELNPFEIDIVENVPVSRSFNNELSTTGQDAAMRLFDVLCPQNGDAREGHISPVGYEQGEDNSLIVNKCTFKCYVNDGNEPPEPPKPYFAQPDSLSVILGNIDEDGTLWPHSEYTDTKFVSMKFNGLKTISDASLAAKFKQEPDDLYELYGLYQNNMSSVSFEDVEHIGWYGLYEAFSMNYQLKEVHFPTRTIDISRASTYSANSAGTCNFQRAFQYCLELSSPIVLDVSCDNTAYAAFSETFSNTHVPSIDVTLHAQNLTANTTFYHMAYYNREITSLSVHIDVPGNLDIQAGAFESMAWGCTKLSSYTIDFSTCTKVPTLRIASAINPPAGKTLYVKVPEDLYDAWTTAPVWNTISATFIV